MDERDYEWAARLAQGEIDHALDKHRQQMQTRGEGRATCTDCGDSIPEERRQAVNATLCVECQEITEKQQRMKA